MLMKDLYTGTASAHGIPITYYDSAPDDVQTPPVVLLHGTGGSAANNFWALFPMLAMRRRVVALDFVDPDDTPPSGEHYVAQVLAVLDAVGAPHAVHLVGYSFGAVIAALVAARHAERLHSLTLVAGWVKTDTHQALRNRLWQSLHDSGHEAIAPFTVFTQFSAAFLNTKNEAEIEQLLASVRQGPDRSRKMAFNRQVDLSEVVTQIQTPTLVIGCVHDLMTPLRHARMLFGALTNARYAELLSGHGVVHERPSELFYMIDQFVQAPERTPAGQIIPNTHA